MRRRPAIMITALSALLVLAADQASKAWAVASLARGQEVTVIPGWLWFRLTSNSGATLGLLSGHNGLFIAVSVLVAAAVAVIVVRGNPAGALGAAALGGIAGGAISNLAHRVLLGRRGELLEIDCLATRL